MLAWRRTALALFVTAILIVRSTVEVGLMVLSTIAGLAALVSIAFVIVGQSRQALLVDDAEHRLPSATLIAFSTFVVWGCSVVAALAFWI